MEPARLDQRLPFSFRLLHEPAGPLLPACATMEKKSCLWPSGPSEGQVEDEGPDGCRLDPERSEVMGNRGSQRKMRGQSHGWTGQKQRKICRCHGDEIKKKSN